MTPAQSRGAGVRPARGHRRPSAAGHGAAERTDRGTATRPTATVGGWSGFPSRVRGRRRPWRQLVMYSTYGLRLRRPEHGSGCTSWGSASKYHSAVRPPVVAVLGPTASGKSALGIALAERFSGEIINCDSTAVYRGFDIGTDKVPVAARRGIPHHLIDIVDPTEEYTAAQYARDAAAVVRDVHARGRLPILAGGTGFYFRALTRGLFPGPGRDVELRQRLETIAGRR